jgi:hypothetical protein
VRGSTALALSAAGAALALELCWLDALARERDAGAREASAAVVRRLGLTDLALFTEARYTRHPSQADRFAPVQDHPHALEHFPSGSVAAPPERPE